MGKNTNICINQKETGEAILILDKVDYNPGALSEIKRGIS